jgi:recombination protein RecA
MALKFYSSLRIDIRRIAQIKVSNEAIGSRTRIKIVKNKLAPPFREVECDIIYGEGISKESDLLDLAVKLEIVEKSGSWYSYDGERIGQGRENVRTFLKGNHDVMDKIEEAVREKSGLRVNRKVEKTSEMGE